MGNGRSYLSRKLLNMSYRLKGILFFIVAIISIVIGISFGSVFVSPKEIIAVFSLQLFQIPLPEEFRTILVGIVWELRLPRVLLAFVAGAILAVTGAIMQSLLKNPLASPYGLGVSSGAGLGVALAMVSGIGSGILGVYALPIIGLISGIITVTAVIMISKKIDPNLSSHTIILTGMVASLFSNAVMSMVASTSSEYSQRILLWQLGSLSLRKWSYVIILFVMLVISLLIVLRYTRELDILSFGEEQALSMGVDHKRFTWIFLFLVSALIGTLVSFVGIIGFLDMISPHIVRRIFGHSHKYVIPFSALFGGSFLVIADLLARTLISPSEIPIGSITALVGAPFFILMFLQNGRNRTC